MGARHSRLAAAMAAAWEAEVVSARRLTAFADRVADPSTRARLLVLAAFCRAHASRVLARLAALGRGPLPVPPEEVVDEREDLLAGLHNEIANARAGAQRYQAMAEVARAQSDLSSAWVCELNRSEAEDLAGELGRLLEQGVAETLRDDAARP
ncbi:MAG: hypothetical protein ACOZIN_03265 [Myxococcota bacterium]